MSQININFKLEKHKPIKRRMFNLMMSDEALKNFQSLCKDQWDMSPAEFVRTIIDQTLAQHAPQDDNKRRGRPAK